jgi:PAS domain S-box-containing protein
MTIAALHGTYDYHLVSLSVFISMLAAYAALELTGRLASGRGRARLAWMGGGAVAMGTGIWAMHYIGMGAFQLSVRVLYDWPTVLLSLLASIAASSVALFTASRRSLGPLRLAVGGTLMGCGIAAMHSMGIQAMRLQARCFYSPQLIALLVLLAIAISVVALRWAFAVREQSAPWSLRKIATAVTMGLAIPLIDYAGMAAATFVPMTSMNGSLAHAVDFSRYNVAGVAAVTVLMLGIVFLSASVHRQFALQAQHLATSRLQLKTIFDNISEGILVLDRRGETVLVNKAAICLLSLAADSPEYETVLQQFDAFSVDGEPLPPSQWPAMRALRGEFVQNFEMLFRNKATGETGAREISTAPVTGAEEGSGHVIIVYRDITERRQIDDWRNQLAAIVESSADAIIGKTIAGIVTSWNKGAERIFGYRAEEMIGQPLTRIIPEERLPEEVEILERIGRGETIDHFETVRRTKSGQFIHVSLTISPIRNAAGKVVGASKIARDITERRVLENQLLQSQKLESVGQLAAGIAHEINTPTQFIGDNVRFLKDSFPDLARALTLYREAAIASASHGLSRDAAAELTRAVDSLDVDYLMEEAPKAIDQALDGIARVTQLVRAMKEFSHPGFKEKSLVDLNRAIRSTLTVARNEWKLVARLSLDLDPELPLVSCLPDEFNQVILNLIVNACHAIEDAQRGSDGALGEIKVQTRNHEHWVEIRVQDSGTGIPETIQGRIFDPFFTTKEIGKGTGQGLSIARSVVVDKHGGSIDFETQPGVGSTFIIRLPHDGHALDDCQPHMLFARSLRSPANQQLQ